MKHNRAWIYCRIDAPEDTHGALKNQRKQLMDYAEQMGFEVVGCSDDMAGGFDFNCPGLKRLIEAVGRGEVDVLIIHNLSRIGHDVCEAMEYLNQIEQMAVRVYSPLEGRLEFTMQRVLREVMQKQVKTIIGGDYGAKEGNQ